MSGSRSPLRERARNVLVDACADGSLEHSLGKPDTFSNFDVDLNSRDQSPVAASDGSGGRRRGAMFWMDPAAGSDGGGSAGSAEFHRHKPPSHGLQAALQLAAKQNDTCKECHIAPQSHGPTHGIAAALQVAALHEAASVDGGGPTSPASCEGSGSNREEAGKARVELERTMMLEKEEKNLAKKFAEADRQAAAKELALKLYRERSIYVEAKLRPLLDKLVAQVSAPDQRPDNPVPLMIELLAEFAGKPTTYFKTGPEDRLMKEILVLENEIDDLAKQLDIESVDSSESD